MKNSIQLVIGNSLLLFVLCNFDFFAVGHAQVNPAQEIWSGIGGKEKWEATNYILFTVTGGGANGAAEQNTRRYLIAKNSGKARFEGYINGSKHVLLFDFKQRKVHKAYDANGNLLSSFSSKEFEQTLDQFDRDFATLCIPANIARAVGENATTKIVNAERFLQAPFQINGRKGVALIASESGLLRQLECDQNTISIDGHKDIGNGLILPTRFKNLTDDRRSVYFQTIASFTSMESTKFETY